jgi:hypothetical protein
MTFSCNRVKTHQRRKALETYLTTNILGSDFICRDYGACKSSHAGSYYEGQLHHIGQCYDILADGAPLRVMIVGQEYGQPPARVSCEARHEMIMSSGIDCRFTAESGHEPRNPHMRGTTSVLRLLFGIPLGADFNSEFISIDGERRHIFEAFALVNYLLCSAVTEETKTRGLATPEMKKNCLKNFRVALEILEPSVVIVQGKRYWPSVQNAFDEVTPEIHQIYRAKLGSMQTLVAVFTHPSAHYPHNWGTNDHTPYLLSTVVTSVAWIRRELLLANSSSFK